MQLESQLSTAIQEAFASLFKLILSEEACKVQLTRKEFEGTFSFPIFPFCKKCQLAPAELAAKIGAWLQTHTTIVDRYQVVGGFLNILIKDETWISILHQIANNAHYGELEKKNSTVLVEFSSPNTNKPQHLGHLRNNFIGSALAAILEAGGYKVHKVNLINDRGIHICKSMVAYQQFGNNETPVSSGLKGDHFVGKYYVKFDQVYKAQLALITDNQEENNIPLILQQAQNTLINWEKGDPTTIDLWKKMNTWVYDGFNATYTKLGITFDKTYYESEVYLLSKSIVEEGLAKNIFYKRADGAIAIDLTSHGLDEKVVLRSDGTAVYITQDLGIADLRYHDYPTDKIIYVVGNEQIYHFKVLFAILERLGRPYAATMYHLPYGMVELPHGKMKSREGTVVDADNLIAEMLQAVNHSTERSHALDALDLDERQALYHTLTMGALKFFLLRVTPQKTMLFNPDESIDFHGDTGTFIQYTYVRIRSLARKAEEITLEHLVTAPIALNALEQQLIFQLYMFPTHIEEAAKSYMPSIIAQYTLELAKTYNRFYAQFPIWKETNISIRNFRLLLSETIGTILKKGMALLTIELPERM